MLQDGGTNVLAVNGEDFHRAAHLILVAVIHMYMQKHSELKALFYCVHHYMFLATGNKTIAQIYLTSGDGC